MVAVARPVIDSQLDCIREGAPQELLEALACHSLNASHAYASDVEEIGLFPLGIVLLPTERVPLHIFEPRYRELIGECVESGDEFGLLYADEEGLRSVGTRARVAEVVERFDDGRMTIVVEGSERFTLLELTRGRSFGTGRVEALVDLEDDRPPGDAVTLALGAFRALAQLAEAEEIEVDERSPLLSFELAAHVALPGEAKQQLLELRSERERLELVAELIDEAGRLLLLERELAERASRNGHRTRS
jgi:Lon protease-like protein